MNILVTDGENRSALAVTRSLGRAGCNIFVTGKEDGNIAACSKYCRKTFTAPDPLKERGKYFGAIAEIVMREEIEVTEIQVEVPDKPAKAETAPAAAAAATGNPDAAPAAAATHDKAKGAKGTHKAA